MPDTPLHKLSKLGQSVWIDYLSRDLVRSGGLARMMKENAVTGVTSNPTIFRRPTAPGCGEISVWSDSWRTRFAISCARRRRLRCVSRLAPTERSSA